MRIETVYAVAFGPLEDAVLDLAPGLNVVYGRNEAGKSSWHAAIYAALCGMRRGRGAQREDREFAERHKPWCGERWEVRAVVALEGNGGPARESGTTGRRIELRQDLAGRVGCSARDMDLGRDVSAEIIHDGSPDASRWLGLTRRSFLSVACVRQAEIDRVVDDADSLQDCLQRAAASSARSATAARAIASIEEFHREHVGLNRANSTRPLRAALERRQECARALEAAQREHREWLELDASAVALARDVESTRRGLQRVRVMIAQQDARAIRLKVQRARELAERQDPAALVGHPEDDELARRVTQAVEAWVSRPSRPTLTGRPSAAIREELDALPRAPEGEVSPAGEIRAARAAFERAFNAVAQHDGARPAAIERPDTCGLSSSDLRDLARDLETDVPQVDPALEQRHRAAEEAWRRLAHASTWRPHILVAAAVAVIAAVVAGWSGSFVVAVPLLVAGVAALLWALLTNSQQAHLRALGRLREIEPPLEAQRAARDAAEAARQKALARVRSLGLPDASSRLRQLAALLDAFAHHEEEHARWAARRSQLQADEDTSRVAFSELLVARGHRPAPDPLVAFEQYARACDQRRETTARASRRESLERELAARESLERADAVARQQVESARARLLDAARQSGSAADTPEAALDDLARWQQQYRLRLQARESAARGFGELRSLLGDDTLDELEQRALDAEQHADRLRAAFAAASGADQVLVEPGDVLHGLDLRQEESRLERTLLDQTARANAARGEADNRARTLPSVAEAEEALASAEREWARVQQLEATLIRTLRFLRDAEERVHRDIAPVLARGLRLWLPKVTGGRYLDATVDPESLDIRVLGRAGDWREARRLSRGTQEQIYLLLHVVMAQHLVTTGERCPLILDDVTVQADAERKRALLEVFRAVSLEQQVIVFTQEDALLEWARDHLREPGDRLIELPAPLTTRTEALVLGGAPPTARPPCRTRPGTAADPPHRVGRSQGRHLAGTP